jgi:multiple sugar transport system permease protein
VSITSPRKAASAAAAYAVLTAIGILFIAPLIWLVLASFNKNATLAVSAPAHPTLLNFRDVLNGNGTLQSLVNGVVLSGGAAIVAIAVATLAAYPLSRYNLRFKRPFMYVILFTIGLPITAVMVPVYGLFVQFNLINSDIATILFLATSTLPFAIWLMKNFMDGVPVDLEQAAWVDGASSLRSLRYIILPLIAPGIAVVGIFTFILTWGNFFIPFILLSDPTKLPASVTIYQFFTQFGQVEYGQLAAFSIIFTLPVIVLYLLVQKSLGGSFTLAGAIKG